MTTLKAITALVLFVTSTIVSLDLFAQSADGDVKKAATAKSETDSVQTSDKKTKAVAKTQSKDQDKDKDKDKDKAFIPSEEISEDYAVSFPVDI